MAETKTCVYCGEVRPFTEEHVFPAGLGGDDSRFMLVGLVCGDCNTRVFGPLERELMRNSPTAVARQFLMTNARRDGGAPNPPTLQTDLIEIFDPSTQLALEAELLAGGKPILRPQIVFDGDQIPLTGSSEAEIGAFLAAIGGLLGEATRLIVKQGQGDGSTFEITEFTWDGTRYNRTGMATQSRPPTGIWHTELVVPANAKPGARYASRLFQRSQGQLLLRALPTDDPGALLTKARILNPEMVAASLPPSLSIERPEMHMRLGMNIFHANRAVAKIGVNHACFEYGDGLVRSAGFAGIKAAILTGTPEIHPLPWNDPQVQTIFSADKRQVHLVLLWPDQRTVGTFDLVYGLRLFGTPFQGLILAQGVPLPQNTSPTVYVIHYENHRIERLSLVDYLGSVIVGPMILENQTRSPLLE